MKVEFDKICFVIMPFGKDETSERRQFDDTYKNIIEKAVDESDLDLKCVRVDQINRSGSIINDIIRYLAYSRFVIADLSGRNANVFYELGIRHSHAKRTILLAQSREDLPFDVTPLRTIMYSKETIQKAEEAKNKLIAFLQEMNDPRVANDSPVSLAVGDMERPRARDSTERKKIRSVLKNKVAESRGGGASGGSMSAVHRKEAFAEKVENLRFHFKVDSTRSTVLNKYGYFVYEDSVPDPDSLVGRRLLTRRIFFNNYEPIQKWPTFYTDFCRIVDSLNRMNKKEEVGKFYFICPVADIVADKSQVIATLEKHFKERYASGDALTVALRMLEPHSLERGNLSFDIWDFARIDALEKKLGLVH